MSTWTLLCLQICCLLGWPNTSSSSTQARSVTSSHQQNVGTSQRMHFSSALPSPGRRHGRIPGRISGNRRNQRGARKPFEVLQVHRVRQDCSRRPSVQQIRHGGNLFSGSHCSVDSDFQVPRDGDYPRLNAGYPLLEADPRGRALLRFLSFWLSLSLSIYISVYPSIYLSLSLSIYISVYPSIYLSLSPVNVSISYLYHTSIPLPVHLFLFIYLSIHISIYPSLSIHRSIYLSMSLPIHLFINSSTCLSVYLYEFLSIYPSIYVYISFYLSIHPAIYLSIYIHLSTFSSISLFIHPSISLSIYQSIRLSIYIYISVHVSLHLSLYLPILSIYVCPSIYLSQPPYLLSFSPFAEPIPPPLQRQHGRGLACHDIHELPLPHGFHHLHAIPHSGDSAAAGGSKACGHHPLHHRNLRQPLPPLSSLQAQARERKRVQDSHRRPLWFGDLPSLSF